MNKLMAFLETCGADASLGDASTNELTTAGALAGLSSEELDLVANRDRIACNAHFAASTTLTCLVFPAKDPDQPDQGDQDDAPEEPRETSENRRAA